MQQGWVGTVTSISNDAGYVPRLLILFLQTHTLQIILFVLDYQIQFKLYLPRSESMQLLSNVAGSAVASTICLLLYTNQLFHGGQHIILIITTSYVLP